MCGVRNERYTARQTSFACRLRVEQGWQPGSVRNERGRLAMCGVPAEPFCKLFQNKKAGAGRNYTRPYHYKINQDMAAARSDPQARKTWAAGGFFAACRNVACGVEQVAKKTRELP